jgi:DNA-binding CsgD family transcriptional regulator
MTRTADPDDPPVCIKRALSTWTTCHCPDCRVLHRRLCKLQGAGALHRLDPDLAWARIDAWTAAGYSPAWISSACGLQPRNIESALTERKAGHVRRLGAKVTAIVLAADIKAGTAGKVPALVARRQLQALACHGFDTSRLDAASGISFVSLAAIRRGATATITAAHHHRIGQVYADLSGSFGTSNIAKANARRLGWAPPFAWDNIEDPDETPNLGGADDLVDDVAVARATHGDRVALTMAERVAALAVLTSWGLSDAEMADRLAVTSRTVLRNRKAHGIRTGVAA